MLDTQKSKDPSVISDREKSLSFIKQNFVFDKGLKIEKVK